MENQNLEQDYYFKISYKTQNYKVSQEYQNWKKLMIEKYNNGKEIICPKDDTIIYKIHNDKDEIICPTCNSDIFNCIFCNKTVDYKTSNCCMKAFFQFHNFTIYKYLFTNFEVYNDTKNDFIRFIFICFIPFISLFYFIFSIEYFLFSGKDVQDEKECNDNILIIFIFLMTIIYGVFFYFMFIIFFILSIPFKLYPIKILFGIIKIFLENF